MEQYLSHDDVVQLLRDGSAPEEQPTDCTSTSSCRNIGTVVARQFVHTHLSLAVLIVNGTSDRLLLLE